jgi:alginate O-acetyltransferase complex protein AlgI
MTNQALHHRADSRIAAPVSRVRAALPSGGPRVLWPPAPHASKPPLVFSSIQFVFLFLPLALGLYWIAPRRARNLMLLALSLFFYASGEAHHLWLLLALIAINYTAGHAIEAARSPARRRAALTVAIAADLAALGWFKYAGFFATAVFPLAHVAAWQGIVLPLGISFYVFHNISYVMDVYRGTARARRNPIDFALYISFFPQVIAGPIIRYHDIAPALDDRHVRLEDFASGMERFVVGMAKKMVIANPLGATADRVFALPTATLATSDAWLGLLCYTLQIYFDFSGYSDMAIGLARMFGFEFLENFNYPYVARTIQEFWRRWHISLSNWFRDYLYIPLGGSRCGAARTYFNLATVFLLCGLWHGAAWTFIVWGAIHGFFLALERAGLGRLLLRAPVFVARAYTLGVVAFAWVVFRSETLAGAIGYYGALLRPFRPDAFPQVYPGNFTWLILVCAVIGATGSFTWLTRDWRARAGQLRGRVDPALAEVRDGALVLGVRNAMLLGLMVLSFLQLAGDVYNPFIYFRF